MRKAVIAGTGAGASVMAMTLAEAGWHVVMLEKGPNYFHGLGKSWPPTTVFSNDEIKARRNFENPDPSAYPRTFRTSASQKKGYYVGAVNELPVTVGGGTVHYGAAMPRFWDIDFKQLSMLGPQPDADVADWPFEYADIAHHYTELEHLIGVQGDIHQTPHDPVRKHSPRTKQYPMKPGPEQRSAKLVADGARSLGYHPYPFPSAINSEPYAGRPKCANCGFCNAYGCPTTARGSALDLLHRALITGRVEIRPETMVHEVVMKGRRAVGLRWVNQHGHKGVEHGDVVVLAASAIESARLALMSDIRDPHHRIGKRLMFHYFTSGFGVFLDQRLHSYKTWGAETNCMEDFGDPDFDGAREAAQSNGLPYIRGGLCELGGSEDVMAEATFYQYILGLMAPQQPFGRSFKELMRSSLLRERLAGISLIGHDLPYLSNNVTLDPKIRDRHGFPVPRITYAPGKHETVAQNFYMPLLSALLKAAGATLAAAVPANTPLMGADGVIPATKHVLGGMQMGTHHKSSVVDEWGRIHTTDNVYVADGGVFATSGASNPTLTIMAVVMRLARHLAGHHQRP
ncbi:MAG: GMC family oxidoreductase [Frankiaceae bacterium]|nr:GMC family oxidoreductase [Frankiaceae bacterium]MBV9870131.1 GMC family oxidoreductase [Frankiaceae bacterium]